MEDIGPSLAPSAQSGFVDGSSYDAHRPSYPSKSVSALLNALGVAQGGRILDLGAGTGKFTELLSAQPEQYQIIAVEPHDGMRATLEVKGLPHVEVRKGFATAIPLKSGEEVDAVIVAQAFHWFATQEALEEIARVLKPGRKLGLIWNIEDYNNTLEYPSPHPWTLKIRRLLFDLDALAPNDAVRFRNERWRAIFKSESIPFQALPESYETWTRSLTDEELWARLCTLSQIAAMKKGGEELRRVRETFDVALADPSTERDEYGQVIIRGQTIVAYASKKY